ncbi:MAG: aldehyde ferredoxin oxidoreductase C-terminal domain-containing protein [Dehalococcoidales bacterium]|nr:aldehyde ferredoxin oxidoreductase C-terminal domain-containing protein [Dehalococcoidales bacterium]
MFYGWAGANLEVDLSRGKTWKEAVKRESVEALLGGKGTNARILWDRVPPEVDAFSPDNLLIVGTGALVGTMLPSANRTIITFKSPVTGIKAYSAMGGFFGAKLKAAGYDTIIISGKSPVPVYLWIDDDRIEIRDASHLWGKGIFETRRIIEEELSVDGVEVICIGAAGENRVFAASIEGTNGVSASRAGPGAVMGDKKLKAIAVHGTKDINIADGARFVELCQQIMDRSGPVREKSAKNESATITYGLVGGNIEVVGHFSGNIPAEVRQKVKDLPRQVNDFAQKFKAREVACYNCPIRCKWVYPSAVGEHAITIKCQHSSAGMIHSRIIDCGYGMKFYSLCQEHGLDDISLANYIGFAIDLYQRGILTEADTGGMELEWGNPEAVYSLIEKIVRREGIGDVLADGVYRAAQRIGKSAENYTYHTKKLEPLPFDVRGKPHVALPIATIDKADRTRGLSGTQNQVWQLPREEREAYIKAGFFQFPEEFEKYFLTDFDMSGRDYEGLCQFAVYNEEILAMTDMLGVCFFWTNFFPYPPINSRALMADLISAATGMDVDEAEATRMARRVINLTRAYNVREGISRKDDNIPKIFFQKAAEPPYHQFDQALLDKWLDRYYELKGWDERGIPTAGILAELGLDGVRRELENRGILAAPGVVASTV